MLNCTCLKIIQSVKNKNSTILTENIDMNSNKSDKNDDLRDKYHKLVEHNAKLVDLLKTTMQIQTDMFRKLIHYVFP